MEFLEQVTRWTCSGFLQNLFRGCAVVLYYGQGRSQRVTGVTVVTEPRAQGGPGGAPEGFPGGPGRVPERKRPRKGL
jgi:hypothetical protein